MTRRLRERFALSELCIVSQDDYYLPRNEQHKDDNDEYNFDLPQSFNKKKFRSDLLRLISGKTVTIQEYTFNNPDAEPKLEPDHAFSFIDRHHLLPDFQVALRLTPAQRTDRTAAPVPGGGHAAEEQPPAQCRAAP